jgi:hypothetical protein
MSDMGPGSAPADGGPNVTFMIHSVRPTTIRNNAYEIEQVCKLRWQIRTRLKSS